MANTIKIVPRVAAAWAPNITSNEGKGPGIEEKNLAIPEIILSPAKADSNPIPVPVIRASQLTSPL